MDPLRDSLIRTRRRAAATFSSCICSAHCKRLRNSSSAVMLAGAFFRPRGVAGTIATKSWVGKGGERGKMDYRCLNSYSERSSPSPSPSLLP